MRTPRTLVRFPGLVKHLEPESLEGFVEMIFPKDPVIGSGVICLLIFHNFRTRDIP